MATYYDSPTAEVWYDWNGTTGTAATTGTVWYEWNGTTATSSTCYPTAGTSAAACARVWMQWNTLDGATGLIQGPGTAWTSWTATGSATCRVAVTGVEAVPEPETEAEREERRRVQQEYQARRREQQRLDDERWEAERPAREAAARLRLEAEAAAEAKAEALLVDQLDAGQRAEHAADRSFTVVTASGRRYRVRKGWAGNVEEIDDAGKATVRYCIHPTIGVPHPDNQLAQKLMLEHDEAGFRKVACATPLTVARTG